MVLCEWCSGSGEGQHDGTVCRACNGLGESPNLDDEDLDDEDISVARGFEFLSTIF